MDGVGGYRAWRWIFLIEGAVTVLIGVMAFFIIPDWPETAKFLKPEERTLLLSTLHEDSGPAVMNRLDKKAMKRAFSDWKIYLGLVSSLISPRALYMARYNFSADKSRRIPDSSCHWHGPRLPTRWRYSLRLS